MALSTTVWYDKNNDRHTGYIKDGKTFVDENATARVPVGATVQTAGGTFKMTDNGGVPTAATARNQFLQGTDAAINAYKAAGQIQNDRINSATNAAIAELNRQKQIAGQNRQDADRAARDAYRAAANPFGAMEEQRVRLGLDNSGYAESSKLRIASDLAAQLTANQRAMNEQLRDIDVQIAEARAQGKYELANMLEARAQNIMQNQMLKQNTLYSTDMQAMNMAENTRQFNDQMAYNKEMDQREWDYSIGQDEYNKKLAKAEVLAQFGDFSGFGELGYTPEQVNMMKKEYDAQRAQEAALAMAKATRSGSSGGGPKPSKPVLTFAQVNDAIKNGRITPSVMSAYEYYYGAAYAPGENETDYISMAYDAQRKSGKSMDEWIDEFAGIWGLTNADKQELRIRAMGGGGAPAPAGSGAQTSGEAYNGFGAQYNSIFKSARDKLDRGQSKADIVDYLDRFDVDALSDAGYRYILEKLFKDER